MNDYIHIGKIVAAFGLKGELVIKHVLKKKLTLKNVEAIFVEEQKGMHLPYFVQSAKPKNHEEVIVTFDGIISKEKAQRLVSKNIWLSEDDFKKLADKDAPVALLGYSIINEGKNLGVIDEVIEQPHQILVRILINGKEALIPLHEESLLKIDRRKKEVHVSLPDGLLEIYS